MRLDQLHHIVAVANFGSISNAAKQLHMTQPTISQSILALENELGVRIFERKRQGLFPTEHGQQLICTAVEVLQKVDAMKRFALKGEKATMKLTFGSTSTFTLNVLSSALRQFQPERPFELGIKEGNNHYLEQLVCEGEVECAFVGKNTQLATFQQQLIFKPLFTGKIMLCVSKFSPLAKEKVVTLKDIKDLTIITSKSNSIYYNQIYQYLKEFNLHNDITKFVINETTEKQLIADNFGVSFCTSLLLMNDPFVKNGDIRLIELADINLPIMYGIVTQKNQSLTDDMKQFIVFLKQYLVDQLDGVYNVPTS